MAGKISESTVSRKRTTQNVKSSELIASLEVELPTRTAVRAVKSLAKGTLRFESSSAPTPWREEGYQQVIRFALPLDIDDMVKLETRK
jgi:hypothetical protein